MQELLVKGRKTTC